MVQPELDNDRNQDQLKDINNTLPPSLFLLSTTTSLNRKADVGNLDARFSDVLGVMFLDDFFEARPAVLGVRRDFTRRTRREQSLNAFEKVLKITNRDGR